MWWGGGNSLQTRSAAGPGTAHRPGIWCEVRARGCLGAFPPLRGRRKGACTFWKHWPKARSREPDGRALASTLGPRALAGGWAGSTGCRGRKLRHGGGVPRDQNPGVRVLPAPSPRAPTPPATSLPCSQPGAPAAKADTQAQQLPPCKQLPGPSPLPTQAPHRGKPSS